MISQTICLFTLSKFSNLLFLKCFNFFCFSKNKVRKRKDDDNLSTPSTSSDEQQQQPNNNNNNALNENSKNNCTHIKKSILDIGKLQKSIYQHSKNRKIKFCVECEKNSTTTNQENENDFEYDETCWLCLKCGIQLCGRARAAHALNHYSVIIYIILNGNYI